MVQLCCLNYWPHADSTDRCCRLRACHQGCLCSTNWHGTCIRLRKLRAYVRAACYVALILRHQVSDGEAVRMVRMRDDQQDCSLLHVQNLQSNELFIDQHQLRGLIAWWTAKPQTVYSVTLLLMRQEPRFALRKELQKTNSCIRHADPALHQHTHCTSVRFDWCPCHHCRHLAC